MTTHRLFQDLDHRTNVAGGPTAGLHNPAPQVDPQSAQDDRGKSLREVEGSSTQPASSGGQSRRIPELARIVLEQPEQFQSLLEAVWPTMKRAITLESIPRHEIADVAQEASLALWKNCETIATCADDRDAHGFVYTVARHKAINAKRRVMQSRPLALGGWYPDPDGSGDRLRRFDGRRWTDHVRSANMTIEELPPSARAQRLRPRQSPATMALPDSSSARTEPRANASGIGADRTGGDCDVGRFAALDLSSALRAVLTGKQPDRPIECLRCNGPCRYLEKVRPATCYAILALCTSEGQLDDLLREGLSDHGITGSHRRNRYLACCLALLETYYPGIGGVEVLRALDSAVSSCRSNRAYDAADRLSAWRRAIETRDRDRQR